ncbi:MAG: hypothetical protein ACETWM_09690 [Candidatus Lokiarchaeia archaeon]
MSSSRENDSVKDGGVPDNIALIVMVLSLLAIGSLLMLVFFLEILVNPYSLPVFWYSGMGYSIYFPFYDI